MLRRVGVAVAVAALLAGCGGDDPVTADKQAAAETLPPGVRRIGSGPRFQPPLARGPVADCRRGLGRRVAAHVELFAADRVVVFAAGIGTAPPRRTVAGRIAEARCYGAVVTIDPTGLVLVRPGSGATLGDLFDAWGRPLSASRVASFEGKVRVYVGGRRRRGAVRDVPLRRHDEIVIEVGPYVPPHASYEFPAPF